MTEITIQISGRARDGLLAAAANNNQNLTDFITNILIDSGTSYADLLKIGKITSAEFVRRFSVQEYYAILTAAESNPPIRNLIDALVKEPEVTLDDPRLMAGLQVLVAALPDALPASRIEELLSYEVPG